MRVIKWKFPQNLILEGDIHWEARESQGILRNSDLAGSSSESMKNKLFICYIITVKYFHQISISEGPVKYT